MQIKLLGFIPEIVVALRLRKHKECKALFKSGRGNLAFEDLVYSAAKLLLQLRGRLEPSVDRFVDRPERLAGHETVARVATGPIRKHSITQQ